MPSRLQGGQCRRVMTWFSIIISGLIQRFSDRMHRFNRPLL
jgi:hypothetical protein